MTRHSNPRPFFEPQRSRVNVKADSWEISQYLPVFFLRRFYLAWYWFPPNLRAPVVLSFQQDCVIFVENGGISRQGNAPGESCDRIALCY